MHIVSITVKERNDEVPEVQKVLTKYGKNIISRLGLHNTGKNKQGLIIIVYEGQDVQNFIDELEKIEKIDVKSMKIL